MLVPLASAPKLKHRKSLFLRATTTAIINEETLSKKSSQEDNYLRSGCQDESSGQEQVTSRASVVCGLALHGE